MKPLAPWERRVFTAAATAALDVPEFGTASLAAADRVVRWLPAGRRRMLRAFLVLLEFGGPGLRLRRSRFSSLSRSAAADLLAAWSEARPPGLRRGVAGLRALAALAHYGTETSWAGIGYDGPWLGRVDVDTLPAPWPITPAPLPLAAAEVEAGPAGAIEPVGAGSTAGPFLSARGPRLAPSRDVLAGGLTLGRSATRDLVLRCDAVVVGAGAGGSTAFAKLAAAGLETVLLDAGGAPGAADFDQRELDMMPLLYRDAGLRSTDDEAIGIVQGTGVGGSTLHNTGLVVPPPPGIRERWRHDHGLPWAEERIGTEIAAVMEALGARPIPPAQINAMNGALRAGAEALGWSSFVARHNRVACSGCGYCAIGCAYNRKTNAAFAFVAPALRAGGRVLADARAERIREEESGWRVRGVLGDAAGRRTGRRFEVYARLVVVACGALDTPVLLRSSGLGGPRVGDGLRLHPAPLITGVFAEDVLAWRGVPQSVLVDEFATFYRNGRGGFLLLASNAGPGVTAALRQGTGSAHRRAMVLYARSGTAAVLLHDESAGRVREGAGGRPRVTYRPGRVDRRELRRGMFSLGRLLLAGGAREVHLPVPRAPVVRDVDELRRAVGTISFAPHMLQLSSVHPQGSCALGIDAERAPCDPWGRLRGAPGIYVADASLFPTSVGVPPQVTVMVLAGLVAEAAIRDGG